MLCLFVGGVDTGDGGSIEYETKGKHAATSARTRTYAHTRTCCLTKWMSMPAIFLVQKLSTACGSGALGSVVCLLCISGVSAPPSPFHHLDVNARIPRTLPMVVTTRIRTVVAEMTTIWARKPGDNVH